MAYLKYNKKYYNTPKHTPSSNIKKVLLGAISKTPLVSSYYYQLMKILNALPKNAKVLDVGCAHGGFLNFIHGVRPDLELYGTDLSDVKGLLPNYVKFIKGDVLKIKPKVKFDLVTCRHLIEHMAVSDIQQVFNRFKEFLKPGGTSFVLAPRLSREFFNDPTHIRPYNKTSLNRLYDMSGFKSIKTFDGSEINWVFNIFKRGMRFSYGVAKK